MNMFENFNRAAAARTDSNWMQTFSGGAVWPTDIQPDDLKIHDIAHALSKLCRYGGHCLRFYSVAEHSCLIADSAKPEHKLTALLHDASEAFLVDVPRPLKPALLNYKELEDKIMLAIAEKFGVEYPLPREVKELDNRILADEREQNMATPPRPWVDNGAALGVRLEFWSPEKAAFEFLARFYQLGGQFS
jgi:hypothetical protein